MALTFIRWLTLAVAGCVLVFYALTGFEPTRWGGRYSNSDGDPVRNRIASTLDASRDRSRRLVNQYRIAFLLDSIRQSIAAVPATTSDVRGFYDKSFPAEANEPLRALLSRAVARDSQPGRVGVDVFFVYDSSRMVHGIVRSSVYSALATYRFPASAGERCTVLIRIGRIPAMGTVIPRVIKSTEASDQLLGPCAFYRAFGNPGAQTGVWLRRGGWFLGIDGAWAKPKVALEPRGRTVFPGPSPALAYLTTTALRCVIGEMDRCEKNFVEGQSIPPLLVMDGANVTNSINLGPRLYGSPRFGQHEPEVLGNMVGTIGRDRFEKFWTSSETLPVAFQQSAGEPLSGWVLSWMLAHYGEVERGPAVGALGLLAILSGVGVLGLLSLWAYRFRRYV